MLLSGCKCGNLTPLFVPCYLVSDVESTDTSLPSSAQDQPGVYVLTFMILFYKITHVGCHRSHMSDDNICLRRSPQILKELLGTTSCKVVLLESITSTKTEDRLHCYQYQLSIYAYPCPF